MYEHSEAGVAYADDALVLDLTPTVQHRLRTEIGAENADEVIRCLRTAQTFLGRLEADSHGLRFAASAAYNLREALNRIVESHDPADGGLPLVLTAWATYEAQVAVPDSDHRAARETFDSVMRTVASGKSRATSYARKLIAHLRQRTGIEPLDGLADPVREFQDLLDDANKGLHGDLSDREAEQLFERILDWFGRVFAPPDEVADRILDLAAQRWSSDAQTRELARIAANSHHLRLFFSAVQDPAWLPALYSAGIVGVPPRDAGWPAAALTVSLGRTAPARVVELLQLVLRDIAPLPKEQWLPLRFEVLRVAVHLGSEGRSVVADVTREHGNDGGVQSLAVHAALGTEPDDPFVEEIADAVLNYCSPFPYRAHYETVKILSHLIDGLTAANFVARGQILAGKTRRLTKKDEEKAASRWLGPEALSLDMADDPQTLPLFAHHLSRLISAATQYNVSFDELWTWVKKMDGEIGERLRALVLSVATDHHLTDAIAHVAARIARSLPTAEDVLLVNSIMKHEPAEGDLRAWVSACGTPSPTPIDEHSVPADWRRIWQWAGILPESVLLTWAEPIDHLSKDRGRPSAALLTVEQRPQIVFKADDSPFDLSTRSPSEVLAILASPESHAPTDITSRRSYEVARAVEKAVKADPVAWGASACDVFGSLQSDEFVEAYIRGLIDSIQDVVPYACDIIDAAVPQLLKTIDPSCLTPPIELEADLSELQQVLLELVRALANHDGDIAAQLDSLWDACVRLIAGAPTTGTVSSSPPEHAINAPWGNSLLTLLALARWEHRNRGGTREEFTDELDTLIGLSTASGLELRAILAAQRPILESLVEEWLESRLSSMFREGPFGRQTFDLTVERSHPTSWFLANCRDDLFDAAVRNVNNAAKIVAIGLLYAEPGYDIEGILDRLATKPVVLAEVVESIAYFVQGADPDSPELARAIQAWEDLISSNVVTDTAVALAGVGRWAYVKSIADDRWLQMTAATLEVTQKRIAYQISVADRVARIPATDDSCTIFLALLDHPEKAWSRQYVAEKAIEMLRSWSRAVTAAAERLLVRLIDLGYYEAHTIVLPTDGPK
ncbi:hypothetical protein ACL02S_11835 [Nocardia sp. 004]|uniref:hypothetical protein n=1 Tax=Nocardia sp. 004 TaxID=3385978 RepID=UPI0039A383F9